MASESRSVTDTASLLVSKGLNVLLIIHKVSNRVNLANPVYIQKAVSIDTDSVAIREPRKSY